jgi:hypothetical protein
VTDASNCPCDGFVHPIVPSNPPGRSAIAYRAGDFHAFRRALLRPLAGEVALAGWRPTGEADLAVQIVEWAAYLADVLTFYNERIANETYLRTAVLPESLTRLIRVLGYRPRPGIGATGTLAALLTRPAPVTLPARLQVQSKPPPGQQPQVFEVGAGTPAGPIDAVAFDPPSAGLLVDESRTILLRDARVSLRPGDRLLLLPAGWPSSSDWAVVTVTGVARVRDPHGAPAIRVSLDSQGPAGATAAGHRVLKSSQTARVWTYTAAKGVALPADHADLDAIHRDVRPGDPVLVEAPGVAPALIGVSWTSEVIWYANGDSSNPANPPASPAIAVPIPHTRITFSPNLTWTAEAASTVLSFGWLDAGSPVAPPQTVLPATGPFTVTAVPPGRFPDVGTGTGVPVLVEDSLGAGVMALATAGAGPTTLVLDRLSASPSTLTGPFRLLFDLVPVSRGASVLQEVLGDGDATVAGQELVLARSPLTYLADQGSASGAGYRSTLRVWVAGVEWAEVPSFFAQPPAATVFVTREDESGRTHVLFGDGINGARLPSGSGNVTASYRFGSGATAPPAGSLTVIATPLPNLRALRNPVAAGGGSDPDPPDQIRRYAPRSVLTFGRAVSRDDYETIAAQAPCVARARAYWAWDAAAQRAMVTVYVGDDDAAVGSARQALAGADDPNRPVSVLLATPVRLRLVLNVRIAPNLAPDPVLTAVKAALADPETGLLGTGAVRIGQPIYESQIAAACVGVPGVLAIHGLDVQTPSGPGFAAEPGPLRPRAGVLLRARHVRRTHREPGAIDARARRRPLRGVLHGQAVELASGRVPRR